MEVIKLIKGLISKLAPISKLTLYYLYQLVNFINSINLYLVLLRLYCKLIDAGNASATFRVAMATWFLTVRTES